MSEALSRNTDPETSREAAAKVDTTRLENLILLQLKTVYDRGNGGLTTAELEDILKVDRVSISPRMRPLADRDKIHDSGGRRKGIVWVWGPGVYAASTPRFRPRMTKKAVRTMIEACQGIKTLLEARQGQRTIEEGVLYDKVSEALDLAGQSPERKF